MAEQDRKRHFILEGTAETERFQSPQQGGSKSSVPNRDRKQHGRRLLGQIRELHPHLVAAREAQEAIGMEEGFGIQVEFESFPDIELAFESLDRTQPGEQPDIKLLNVRHEKVVEEERTFATVLVPDGKLQVFETLIQDYLDESKDVTNGPKNRRLINTISEIRAATLAALWVDGSDLFPDSDEKEVWWEIWLSVKGDQEATNDQFKQQAEELGFRFAPGEIQFPERTVLLAYGSVRQMKSSVLILNSIAELRRSKETAEFFDSLLPDEQPEWLDELLQRLTVSTRDTDDADVPHVCLFDTGVNHGHPLIFEALDSSDLHTVEPGWGTDDSDGHGTGMAGLALMGNLTDALDSQAQIDVAHRLESVKLLPRDGHKNRDARHHGYLTTEAVARPEITSPQRRRLFSMAVTARDDRDRGRPSAWSAALDRLAVDAEGNGESPRLFVVAAGNVENPNAWKDYPKSNSTDGVHDPGQSWNALTVGAATHLVEIDEPDAGGYEPVAPAGGLSPFSTTSETWQPQWPLKPDVVFEGGNAAQDAIGAVWMPSLSLLTTNRDPQERLFTTTNATSAASALAARMAAQLMAGYPELWPETIRALIVHSAEWTDKMQQAFLPATGKAKKKDFERLVRHCGFGIPDLERALWSVENSLTMVCEEQLHPFRRDGQKPPTLGDMHLHRLPWPLQELEALGKTRVEMRVTLSYFIEPNPSARGFSGRYLYESHGLRYDVKRPTESERDFRARINVAARDEEERTRSVGDGPNWVIGKQNRHKGSIHSDIWRGRAADLASRGMIGVYPAAGWWQKRPRLERYGSAARYALVVSIHAPKANAELYSAVVNEISASSVTQV